MGGNVMCNATKELSAVLTDLLEERKRAQELQYKERHMGLSVKDITLPLVMVVPLLLGGFIYTWQMSKYFSQLEQKISKVETAVDNRTVDRFSRTDMANLCYSWQVKNPKLTLNCQRIAFIGYQTLSQAQRLRLSKGVK